MKTLFSFQSLKAWIAGILAFFASAAQASATGHGHISSTDWWYIGAATVTMIATVYGVGNASPSSSANIQGWRGNAVSAYPPELIGQSKTLSLGGEFSAIPPNTEEGIPVNKANLPTGPIQGPRNFSPSISEGIPRPPDAGGGNGN